MKYKRTARKANENHFTVENINSLFDVRQSLSSCCKCNEANMHVAIVGSSLSLSLSVKINSLCLVKTFPNIKDLHDVHSVTKVQSFIYDKMHNLS